MGLAQKRISQEFQANEFTTWKKNFDQVVGFDVPVEVKWETMQSDDYDKKEDYFEWYKMVYFQPLMDTFKSLCADDMGKEAIKSSLKKIVIDGTEGIYGTSSNFNDGIFNLKHKFNTNVDKVDERRTEWTKMIESKL